MTLNAQELRKRDELLRRAVAEGKLVAGSTLYHTVSDTFAIRPSVAEQIVDQLTARPLPGNQSAASIGSATTPPVGTDYESGWLTGRERERIANARAGYESVSHTFE